MCSWGCQGGANGSTKGFRLLQEGFHFPLISQLEFIADSVGGLSFFLQL